MTLLSACLLHGATFLGLKAGEPVRSNAAQLARRLRWITAALATVAALWTFALSGKSVLSAVLMALTIAGIALAVLAIGRGREGRAFAGTAVTIASLVAAIFAGLYPNVLVSSTATANNLTIASTASGDYALTIMSVIALVLFPVVLIYQGWTYVVFRRRVLLPAREPDQRSHGVHHERRSGPAAEGWPHHPVVHEINAVVWLDEVSSRSGRRLTLAEVPAPEWDAVVPDGVSVVWLMGVWRRSPAGREVALADPELRASWTTALPGWSEADIAGSPYCIREYVPDSALGGWDGLDAARAELNRRGARLMVDWVPNHTGPDATWLTSTPEAYVTGTQADLAQDPGAFLDVDGTVVARGRDPYFAPWPDVVQLNPFADAYRRLAVETLTRIAEHADAVRCDMAMLMLDDVVQSTWGERVGAPPAQTYWEPGDRLGACLPPGLSFRRRGVLGQGVGPAAARFRPLLRQAPL